MNNNHKLIMEKIKEIYKSVLCDSTGIIFELRHNNHKELTILEKLKLTLKDYKWLEYKSRKNIEQEEAFLKLIHTKKQILNKLIQSNN